METESKRVAHNKLSQEKVIEQFKEIHGDEFDYSKVVYVDTNTPVEVYCKKHDFTFTPTPKNHKNGGKCYYCGREAQIEKAKKDKEVFVKEMVEKYGDRYDFSKVTYVNSKIDVIGVCKEHGEFNRKPSDLVQGLGCKKCKTQKSKYNNKDIFIEEDLKIFGSITNYDLVKEISARAKIDLTCNIHNCKFTLSVSARLSGQKCPKCSAENYRKLRALPKEEYYKRANETHDNKYIYNGDYTTSQYTITFYCADHGKQRRNSYDHLKGAGCKKCEKLGNKVDKITKEGYTNTAKGRITSLYLIECEDEIEKFYKIGKTFRGVEVRFKGSLLPYKYNIISEYKREAGEIWELENELHEKYKKYSYKPNKFFAGFSECYKLDLPIEEIINL